MRITHPTGRNVVLTSPLGEEYDARLPSPAVAPRPATVWGDVFGVVPSNARVVWSWDFTTGAIPGYATVAGSASLTREAPTTATDDVTHTYTGSPVLTYNSGATPNSSFGVTVRLLVPFMGSATYYLATMFNYVGGAAGDDVAFVLMRTTGTWGYLYSARFVIGTGWQVLNNVGAWVTLPDTPTAYNIRDWVPVLLVVNTTPQYVSLYAGGKVWSPINIAPPSGASSEQAMLVFEVNAINTTTDELTVRFAQLTLYQT